MSSEQSQISDYKKTQLLKRLLDGVKGCQSRFGSRSELATEDDESVTRLCAAYEDVFSHGFNKALQQSSSSKTAFWVPAALRSSDTSSFWPLIKSQLSKHEAERFLLLHNVRSDAGRCRAWIRASLNEHSLERYILIILSLQNLNEFYEPSAFIRDPELNSILPQTAAGLGSVLFALTVDNPKLDAFIRVMEKDVPEATVIDNTPDTVEVADQAILALSPASLAQKVSSTSQSKFSGKNTSNNIDKIKGKNCKKKKRKPPVNFVSFDDDDDGDNELTGSVDSSTGVGVSTSAAFSSLPATAVSTPTDKKSYHFRQEGDQKGDKSFRHGEKTNALPTAESERKMSETRPNKQSGLQQDVAGVKDSENDSSEPLVDTPFQSQLSSLQVASGTRTSEGDASICSTSVKSVDCISVNSVYSDCSERLDLECASLAGLEVSPSQRLKPIVNDAPSSSKSFNCSNPDLSHDLIPVPSYDSSLASHLHLDVEAQFVPGSSSSKIQSPATPITPGKSIGPNVPQPTKDAPDTTHAGTSENTSRTEDMVQKLKAILDREIETVATLRADLADEKRNSNNQIKILEARIESLSKENEILRHQLKKYVGAVQLLKREGSRRLSLEDDNAEVNNCAENNIDDSSQDAAEYERKLIQVAEMHGELMEFNTHLQRTIQRKDANIRRLKEELVDLRGPLATPTIGGGDDEDDDDSWDIVDSFSSAENSRSRSASATARRLAGTQHSSNERVLINIWIPSAFLTGATNDLHHVYQVFVRIKDTEWNIYRRYSQFYSLHRDLSKNDPLVSSLYFPPKKHLGNKDVKFVDERRRKLQDYLRSVMNHTLQTNSILASHPEKNLLISILPFFGESFNAQTQKPKRERSRTRNLFFRQSGQTSQPAGQGQQLQFSNYPQYTGL